MPKTFHCAAAFMALALPAFAAGDAEHDHAEERREAGAHEHGHGSFAMAIEGDRVIIELEAPAFDIVGFEHEASTEAQHAAMDAAKLTLSDPLSLFALTGAAGCMLTDADIMIGSEGGAHHGDDNHDNHDDHDDHDGHDDDGEAHSEVHAEYALTCADAAAIERLEFAYFDAFPNAEALDVVILSDRGQTAFEATRADRTFDIE